MLTRIALALIGCVCIWTGVFAGLNFNPPPHADPGAVNACWLTFITLIIAGHAFVISSVWRLVK
jgi:hypothetical protein